MSDSVHTQATWLRQVAEQGEMIVTDAVGRQWLAQIAERARQLESDIKRTVAEPESTGPRSYKSEWE